VIATLLTLSVVGAALCMLLTPCLRRLAWRWDLLDRPDGRRKIHGGATPMTGGLAVCLSCFGALAVVFLTSDSFRACCLAEHSALSGLLLGAIALCAIGVADDSGWLRVRFKLLGQVLAILIVLSWTGLPRAVRLFDREMELGILAAPLLVLWLLAVINALNLIDGMDGLLTSVGLLFCTAIAAAALMQGQEAVAAVAVALAGTLAGFLPFNWPRASIFLGDSGSMFVGLVIGTLAILGTRPAPDVVSPLPAAALLTIPLFDTVAAFLRRTLTGQSIYTTDRGHIHHCLLRADLSSCRVLVSVWLLCLVPAAGALVGVAFHSDLYALGAALAVVFFLVQGRTFGHAEWELLKKRLLSLAASLLHRRPRGHSHQIEVRFQGSTDWRDLWNELLACAPRLHLVMVRFNVNAPALQEGYHARWDGNGHDDEASLWRAEIPLVAGGQTVGRLEVRGRQDGQPAAGKLREVAKVLEQFETVLADLAGTGSLRKAGARPLLRPGVAGQNGSLR
jgi:UDP-GlcNAc:undecaprenyl-phosphate GlcNAc-1-phosphate transferase